MGATTRNSGVTAVPTVSVVGNIVDGLESITYSIEAGLGIMLPNFDPQEAEDSMVALDDRLLTLGRRLSRVQDMVTAAVEQVGRIR